MQGIQIKEHGDLDILKVCDIPDPVPEAGEVRIQVKAVGLNHLDLWVRRGIPGHQFPLPLILGSDVAGVVSVVGEGVEDLKLGDEVIVAPGISCGTCPVCRRGEDHKCRSYGILGETRDGGYAEMLVVPRRNCILKPKNLSFAQGAALGVSALTAWHMVAARAAVKKDEWVLVQAAGSGVSSAALQIAKHLGAKVIATSGSDAKCQRAKELGADYTINYKEENVRQRVKKITEGWGADVVIDHVGALTWDASVRSLAWHGRLVTCGATVGFDVEIDLRHLFFKSLSLLGSTMGTLAEMHEVIRLAGAEEIKPILAQTLGLSDAAEAHRLLEEHQVFGKLVLIP
tara:strand:- start:113 stop:1141 length:1029 start_codon:yes stop_codon:yes gene_type:complete